MRNRAPATSRLTARYPTTRLVTSLMEARPVMTMIHRFLPLSRTVGSSAVVTMDLVLLSRLDHVARLAPESPQVTGGKAAVSLMSSTPVHHDDPKSFRDAMYGPNGPLWILSMDLEFKAHMKNGSWVLVPRPPGANVLRSRWVYKTKEEPKEDGLLGTRHKSRICAVGLGQVLGIYYTLRRTHQM